MDDRELDSRLEAIETKQDLILLHLGFTIDKETGKFVAPQSKDKQGDK